MKIYNQFLTAFAIFTLTISTVLAAANPGKSAPDFTLKGQDGKNYTLSKLIKKGKPIVLEWFNNECPYVEKHYGSGNMQKLQAKYTMKGVQWFSIISSAKGKQGYRDKAGAIKTMKERKQSSTAVLLDPTGKVGKLYGAKTTPHMFIINPKGLVAYNGAIDDNSSFKPEDIAGAKNYVIAALDSTLAGKAVAKVKTKPYGCSVKY